jgi:hypothetical protein
MTDKATEPVPIDDLAAAAGLSVREADKSKVGALLVSIRTGVMRKVEALPIESPPALFFDPR